MNNTNESRIKFRKKENPFTQVSNILIDDERLSVQARFLYILINRSITNEDWVFYKSNLQKKMGIKSENTFDKYWKELKKAGYLIQHKFKNEKGRWAYEYELLDFVEDFEPMKTTKKDIKNHTPNFEGVEISEGGKTPLYNNTNSNNTNLNNNNINQSILENNDNNSISSTQEDEGLIDSKTEEGRISLIAEQHGFSISKKEASSLLYLADEKDVIANIIKAKATGNYIANPFQYILTMITNKNNQVQSRAVTSTEEVNPKSFNNFQGREYDYDSLEKKLLGWE